MGDEAGAHRIEFYVAVTGHEVGFTVDQMRLELAFPQRPRSPVRSVDNPDILSANVLHHGRNGARLRGRDQQMHVVGHQHISMNGAAAPSG